MSKILASKRTLILQLVKLEMQFNSLRASVEEEEGKDATDAFCRAHYDLGNGCDSESKPAIAHMELTFEPFTFPGLEDVQDSHPN